MTLVVSEKKRCRLYQFFFLLRLYKTVKTLLEFFATNIVIEKQYPFLVSYFLLYLNIQNIFLKYIYYVVFQENIL